MKKIYISNFGRVVFSLVNLTVVYLGIGKADDWPTYMHDIRRSGVTQETLQPPLRAQWVFVPQHVPQPAWPPLEREETRELYDDAYQVVVAKDLVYFASNADYKVYCLDAKTGKIRWKTLLQGPIRVAPTVWGNYLFVGSDDGFAYCLDAFSGRIIWKLRGGPSGRKVLGNGKMMSVWPVRTGVLVDDGIGYFGAGLFPTESVFIYAFRAKNGQILWCNDTSGQLYLKMPHPGAEGFSGVVPEGPLLASKKRLFVTTGKNMPAIFDRQTGQFIHWDPSWGGDWTHGHKGGSWALLSSDFLFTGPGNVWAKLGPTLVALTPDKQERFIEFAGRRLLVDNDTIYLLSDRDLSAIDRARHCSLVKKREDLSDQVSKLDRMIRDLKPGFINDWWIIGPFDLGVEARVELSVDKTPPPGFSKIYPPEKEINLKKKYKGKEGKIISWKKAKTSETGHLNFDKLIKPNEYVVAYALSYVYSPQERKGVKILTGSDDGLKVWINDEEVFSLHIWRGAAPDQDSFSVNLKSGWNKILVKVEESWGGWGLYFRIPDCSGLKYNTEPILESAIEFPDIEEEKKKLLQKKANLLNRLKNINEKIQKTILWRRSCDRSYSLILASTTLFVGGNDKVVAFDASTGKQLWTGKVDGKVKGLAVSNGRLFASCSNGKIYCFSKGERLEKTEVIEPINHSHFPKDKLSSIYATSAERIIKETGIKRGYCLLLGCENGRLAFELAKRTELIIYGVERDLKKAERINEILESAGLYGTRITILSCFLSELPSYFANLIVCEKTLNSKWLPKPTKDILRLLRPYGGAIYIGQPAETRKWYKRIKSEKLKDWMNECGIENVKISKKGGLWAKFVRGALPGAGKWTHQYANPSNTSCSNDKLIKCPLGVLWFGAPGPARMIERHRRPPAPVAVNGRFFVSGDGVVMAYDAYNGTHLWEKEIPEFRQPYVHNDCTNLVATEDSVYVTFLDNCLRLDAETGKTLATFHPPAGVDNKPRNWGYLATTGNILLGSGSPKFTINYFDYVIKSKLEMKGIPEELLDKLAKQIEMIKRQPIKTKEELESKIRKVLTEEETDKYLSAIVEILGGKGKTLSDSIFAMNRKTGKLLWVYHLKKGYVYHVGIAVGGGHVFFVKDGKEIITLDLKTGKKVWQKNLPGDLKSRDLTIIYHKGILLLANYDGRIGMMAISAVDGKFLWKKPIGYRGHPIVINDLIYAEPGAYYLKTGEPYFRVNPITGKREKWRFVRSYGCGTISASGNCMFFRSATIGIYDLLADVGTSNWGAMRPGCWINAIAAGGVVLIPEGSSGCTCAYPIKTTLALISIERNEEWAIFTSPKVTPVKLLAINFGASGDRKDENGTLWVAYPRPPFAGITLKLKTKIFTGLGTFRFNSDSISIENTDKPWVFSSGYCGLSHCSIPLMSKGEKSALYTVRLYFAETMNKRPGKRVFAIKIQNKLVAKKLDIFKEAGGKNKALVKEFRDIKARRNLKIEFIPKVKNPTKEQAPLICGIEILRQ